MAGVYAEALQNIDDLTKKVKNNRNEKDRIKVMDVEIIFLYFLFARHKVCDAWQATEEEYERTLQDEAKDLEQLLNKRNLLLSKQDDCKKKIRDLGSLPSDAFERYFILLGIFVDRSSNGI